MFGHNKTATRQEKKNHNEDLCLYNLYRFLFQNLLGDPQHLYYGGGLIQTLEGAFRLGYSEKTRTFFLFYGAHPEDLAVIREGRTGSLSFKHPERLLLIEGLDALGDRWEKDGKELFDASWLQSDIDSHLRNLTRILFHEVALHQLTPSESCAAFIGFKVRVDEVTGEAKVEITTKDHKNHLLADQPPRLFGGADALARRTQSGFLSRARQMLGRAAAPSMQLSVAEMIEGNGQVFHESFDPDGIGSLIGLSFAAATQKIQKGEPPLSFREAPRLWFIKTSGALCARAVAMSQEMRRDFKSAAREIGLNVSNFVISNIQKSSPVLSVAAALTKLIFNYGKREDLNILKTSAKRWRKLIRSHERPQRLGRASLPSEYHSCAAPLDVDQMGDIRPVDLRLKHTLLASPFRREQKFDPYDRDRAFRFWLVSGLLAPKNNTFRYLDAKGELVDPRHKTPEELAAEIKLVRVKTQDGVILHYLPATRTLYAFYHRPTYQGAPNLPRDAATFFHSDEMIRINLSDPSALARREPLHRVAFAQGALAIRTHSKIKRFAQASVPPKEFCGTYPVPPAPQKKKTSPEVAWSCELP